MAGQTTSVFTHEGGLKASAANGPVSLRAHTDTLQIWADQEVTVVSVNDEIHVQAATKIELIGGQSSIDGVKAGVASVEYGEDARAWLPPEARKNADYGGAPVDEAGAKTLYDKYFGGTA